MGLRCPGSCHAPGAGLSADHPGLQFLTATSLRLVATPTRNELIRGQNLARTHVRPFVGASQCECPCVLLQKQ